MLKRLSILCLLMLALVAVAFGQAGDETYAVGDSSLTGANLPAGARQVREQSVPEEMRQTLAKLIAEAGAKVRQGDSEVLIWSGGGYRKANAARMIGIVENNLRAAGWEYETAVENDEMTVFALMRETPARRGMLGFFVPSDDALVFAVTEMLPANAPRTVSESSPEPPYPTKNGVPMGSFGLFGKWSRGTGGGSIDYTGKTQFKSGTTYYFEFFEDGTVDYKVEGDVLSIVQCRIKSLDRARGKYSVRGDSLTIDLNAGTSIGSNSCDAKGNYNKTLPASSVSVKFKVKKMDSMTRPDNPTVLCFENADGETCFEKTEK